MDRSHQRVAFSITQHFHTHSVSNEIHYSKALPFASRLCCEVDQYTALRETQNPIIDHLDGPKNVGSSNRVSL